MSNEEHKFKHSKRLQKDENAIRRQAEIAKENGTPVKEMHRLHKKHAMDCGNPQCSVCGNPRKLYKEPTQQEKRLFQDMETVHHKHSNGMLVEE